MELLLDTVIKLRKLYGFHGYIHLKGIPGADGGLIMRAGEYVDRMSFNLELPSEKSLRLLAPQKNKKTVLAPMKAVYEEKESYGKNKRFLPAGQTTQMIIGASPEKDGQILRLTDALYKKFRLKRVYYSSYVPLNQNPLLPSKPTGLLREHRLYQADWLLRFYGFNVNEIINEGENLAEEYDPKCAWALRHPELFPVDINAAPVEMLVRIPGIGLRSAYKIISARRFHSLGAEDLKKMKVPLRRALNFILLSGKFLGLSSQQEIRNALVAQNAAENYEQLTMFSSIENAVSAITGEL